VDLDGCGAALEEQAHDLRPFRTYLRFEVAPVEHQATLAYDCLGSAVRLGASLGGPDGDPGPVRLRNPGFFLDLPMDAAPSDVVRTAIERSLRDAVPQATSIRVERMASFRNVVVREWMSTGGGVNLERVAEWRVDSEATRILRRPASGVGRPWRSEGFVMRPECGGHWLDFAPWAHDGQWILSRVAVGSGVEGLAFETILLDAVRRAIRGQAQPEDDALAFDSIQREHGSSLLPAMAQIATLDVDIWGEGEGTSPSQSLVFSVDDLLFGRLSATISRTVRAKDQVRVDLEARPDPPLDSTAIGVFRDVPLAIDLRIRRSGHGHPDYVQTARFVRHADVVLERGHGMLSHPLGGLSGDVYVPPDRLEVAVSVSGISAAFPPRAPFGE
jgi:hypothetical protein